MPVHTSLSIPLAKYEFQQMSWVVLSFICLLISFTNKAYGTFVGVTSILGFCLSSVMLFVTVFLSVCKSLGRKIVVKVLRLLYKMKLIKNYDRTYEKITKYISDFQDVMKQYAKSPKDFIVMFILCVGKYIINYSIPFFIVKLFSPTVPGSDYITLFVMSMLVDLASSFFPLPGGTGMNVFNVALVTRAFLFFAYPTKMSGESVWVSGDSIFGLGQTVDGMTAATSLGIASTAKAADAFPPFSWDMVTGLIPGSIGETSVIAILIGAVILLWTGVASWKTMLSVFVGGAVVAGLFNVSGIDTAMAHMPWYEHLCLGGFCFGAVFMATDPVTSARTETGKYIYGFLIGAMAIIIRVLNPGYPEGMMLAILLMNVFAPLIDYCVVQGNISRRMKRVSTQK